MFNVYKCWARVSRVFRLCTSAEGINDASPSEHLPLKYRLFNKSCPKQQISPNTGVVEEYPAHVQRGKKKTEESDPTCHVSRATWERAKPFKEIPGPKALPFVGNTWRFMPKIGEYFKMNRSQLMGALYKQYGDIIRLDRVVGLPNAVYLLSPNDIETIYKQESVLPKRDILPSMTYFRNHMRQEVFKDAKGLISSNGHDWYSFRNKVNAIMMQPKIVKQYLKPVDVISTDFIEKIKKMRNADNKIGDNLMNETNKWALESIAYIALDTRLNCLADDLPIDSIPQKMVQNARDLFTITEKMDFEPSIWKHVTTPTYKKAMRLYDDQLNLAQTHICAAMENIRKKRESGVNTKGDHELSVLEKLLDVDPKVAVVMVSDMLLAGIDTTSTAFVNVLYHLASNTDKQDKLREDITALLPNRSSELMVDHLNQLPYLKACIKEAARIYPVTPGTMRILTKDTVLSGYRIPKGTNLIFLHMLISVLKEQFPRPLEYIPERWLRENVDSEISYKNAHPFTAMHFGFGSRSCIGRRFADLEMEVALVNFIRHFDISWDGPPPTRTTKSLNYLRGPFGFLFKDSNLND